MKQVLIALTMGVGTAMISGCRTSVPAWDAASREETAAWFAENEYGVLPKEADKPSVSFEPTGRDRVMMDGAALRKRVRITVAGPYGRHGFDVTAFIPTAAKKPVPSFVLICNRDPAGNTDPERKVKSPFWPAEEIVRRGYAAITFYNGDVTPDWDTGGLAGIFSCYVNVATYARKPNHWGTIRAWAFGASRVMDWIETEPTLDAERVAVVGHSRGGKAALVTGVTDTRFAMTCVNDSGCSGMKLNRMDLPDSEQTGFMSVVLGYWFCNNYRKWAHDPAVAAPFDQHQYAALIAPRLLAVASASEDRWAGPRGEFESCRLASGAWEACGRKGLVADHFPEVSNTAFQDGCISYHLRQGEHDLTPYDWARYMDFADRNGWRDAVKTIDPKGR